MAFFPVGIDREDAPTVRGVKLPPTSVEPVPVLDAGCSGCSKRAAHSIADRYALTIPHGQSRYDVVHGDSRILLEDANRIQAGLSTAHWAFNGFPVRGSLPVSGTFNEPTQVVGAEMISVSGDTFRCRFLVGQADRLEIENIVANPLWPAPGEPQFVNEPVEQSLPLGAEIRFSNSCYADKRRPVVADVLEINGAEAAIKASVPVPNAMQPRDLAFPPETYFVEFLFPALSPPSWKRLVPMDDAQWVKARAVFSEPRRQPLQGGRVLYWDGCGEDILRVSLVRLGQPLAVLSQAEAYARMETTQEPGAWLVVIDLEGLEFDLATVEYWREAVASDPPRGRLQFVGQCVNAQEFITASALDGGRTCMDRNASQRGRFRAACWQPDCSGFSVVEGGGAPSPASLDDFGDGDFWSSLYTRTDWVVAQRVPGYNEADLARPAGSAGPSVDELAGSFHSGIPVGKFPDRRPLSSPVLGRRIAWEDGGDDYQQILFGAAWLRAHDFSADGGPSYVAEPGDIEEGVCAGGYPERFTGNTDLYDYDHRDNSLGLTNELVEGADRTVVAADPRAVDDSIVDFVESLA